MGHMEKPMMFQEGPPCTSVYFHRLPPISLYHYIINYIYVDDFPHNKKEFPVRALLSPIHKRNGLISGKSWKPCDLQFFLHIPVAFSLPSLGPSDVPEPGWGRKRLCHSGYHHLILAVELMKALLEHWVTYTIQGWNWNSSLHNILGILEYSFNF